MPFALKFGRRPIYILSTALQLGVSVWAAKIQTVADLMLINAFNCFLGSLAEAIVQMTIADLFFVQQRGVTTSIYVWVVVIAISLAPVAAGYITLDQGWRWVWIWVAILLGICLVLFFFFYEETKYIRQIEGRPPTSIIDSNNAYTRPSKRNLIDQSEKKELDDLSVKNGLTHSQSARQPIQPTRKTYIQRLKLWSSSPGSFKALMYHTTQPFFMMLTMPAVAYTALMYGITTACYQITVTVISSYMVRPPYNFTSAEIGLISGIPGFIGTTLSAPICGFLSDRIILWLAKKNRGVYEPEMRLWLMIAFGLFIPTGLLIFGYGLGQGKPWPMIAVGAGIYTFGMTPASSVVLAYATDAYTNIIADAMVGVVFARNVLATIFIFALTPWIDSVGIANVFLTLALIAALFVLLSIVLLIYGKRLRAHTTARYETWSGRQFDTRH
ncbi:Major Facilitator Superfamily [Aspergillus sclerotialis]|uniref:Major Facilitator Superfamily n=1 Tax=Aspergillus sclerotialis TaxID=2070753 RepID=A0A3A2ZID9_9EURO|nr:Major Facilitator Superfamily [Aspergillus sclerotialis]